MLTLINLIIDLLLEDWQLGLGLKGMGKWCWIFIGASLSEPHTSRNALRRCVSIRPCLRPYIVNLKCAFKYFPKNWTTARVQRWQLQRRRLKFMDARHSSYGPTVNGRLFADRTYLYTTGWDRFRWGPYPDKMYISGILFERRTHWLVIRLLCCNFEVLLCENGRKLPYTSWSVRCTTSKVT